MASNALANIAAATAAGYSLERYTLPSGLAGSTGGQNVTRLSRKMSGVEGKEGQFVQFQGESAVSSAAADTAALANLNNWRSNRYGVDSAQASLSPNPTAATSPSTQGTAPTLRSTVKDKD